jgi:hypothetical protein
MYNENGVRFQEPLLGNIIYFITDAYPLTEFHWSYTFKGDPITKFQEAGRHPNYRDVDYMMIHMKGDIIGNDYTDYWDKRFALMSTIVPHPSNRVRSHGRIYITPVGLGGADYYADVILDNYEAPMEALYPTVTSYSFEFICPVGYWTSNIDESLHRL